ncbi:alpha/beta hydrolase [Actinoplanes sp. NPDC049265]|uniref:alpha/beta hydrolase n=1 Tax=Actinoplanes sp. NPDC049265 TaxID=3363902 RepID=UPI00372295A1
MTDVIVCHGAWHQPEHFRALADRLNRDGLSVAIPDLGGLSLPDSHDLVQSMVDSSVRPPLLVAHSNGGITAGTVRGAASMLFLAGWVLDVGESPQGLIVDVQRRTGRAGAPLAVTADADGRVRLDPEAARAGLYADCDEATATRAIELLRPEPPSIFAATPEQAAWRDTPSHYLAAGHDQAIVPELVAAFAARCSTAETWPTGHSAYLSRADDVAELIGRRRGV